MGEYLLNFGVLGQTGSYLGDLFLNFVHGFG